MKEFKFHEEETKPVENLERDVFNNVIGNQNSFGHGFVVENPRTGEEYTFDSDILEGADWTRMYGVSDDIFTPEQIKKYHTAALAMTWQDGWYSSEEMKAEAKTPGYKHIALGGSDTERVDYEIEQDWVQEIWDKVNPGLKLIRHYLNGHGQYQSGGIHIDGWTGEQYTVIVYLTPDMKPEDGGVLELWRPNLTDEMKAMALNTPYTFNAEHEHNMDILESYWPKPGRQVVFDARIPHVARAVESDKFRISLVFKGTTKGMPKLEEDEHGYVHEASEVE
jgi:hypothetical protein